MYVYRGSGKDTLTAFMDEPQPDTWPHGYPAGMSRHKAAGEKMCRDCLDLSASKRRQWYARRKAAKP